VRQGLIASAARGLVAGLAAGAAWWLVESAANWALGGYVPSRVATTLAVLDLGLGALAGTAIGVLLALAGRPVGGAWLALALAGVYGLVRIFDPPGLVAEAIFTLVAAAVVALGAAVAGRAAGGPLAFAQLTLLGAGAVVVGGFAMVEAGAGRLGVALPVVLPMLPVLAVASDRLLGLVVRRRGPRFGLELAAAALVLLVWGRPLVRTPLNDPIVTAVPPPAGSPDVFLVVLDTTRADRLSTFGYARATSPELSAFAADALRFTQARSPAAWTLPGHASLFTGQYPSRHGAHFAGAWLGGESRDGRPQVAFPLSPKAVTMAETLRDYGYRTAGIVANFSYMYRDFGVAQGFGYYEDSPGLLFRLRPPVLQIAQQVDPAFCLAPFRSAHEINAAGLAWLDRVPAGRPVFLFLNYMEAHQPRLASPPHDGWSRDLPKADALARKNLWYDHAVPNLPDDERAFIGANYDGQLAAMDVALGELLTALRARGRYDNALIIVTSDHGEFLGEHGQMGHIGQMLYEPVLHVPLVIKFPGKDRLRGESDTPVQLVDVLPTVLATTGAPAPPGIQGEALPHVTHASLAEEDIDPYLVSRYGEQYDRSIRVLYDGSFKLISTSRGTHMLFDLARDPHETHDLAARDPDRLTALLRRLEAAFGIQIARN
jgi:arylsulfatase A-like enzyme